MKTEILSESIVKEISDSNNEPYEIFRKRENSWRLFSSSEFSQEKDSPTGKYTDLIHIDLKKEAEISKTSIHLDFKKTTNGIVVLNLSDALKRYPHLVESHLYKCIKPENNKLLALNSALWTNGVFIYVPKNVHVDIPIRAIITSSYKNARTFTHTLLIADEGSSLNYYEECSSIQSEYPSYHSNVLEIFAKEGAKVNFFGLQNWGSDVLNFSWQSAVLEKNSEISWNNALFGSRFSIFMNESFFNGENSRAVNKGLFFLNKNQHSDISTNAYHYFPRANNEIDWKGALNDEAVSVYRGLIDIEQEAKQTNSNLKQHTLLLSENAKSNSVPSLSIKTNDVKAKHGTSVGNIDETQMFYLMSRGLSREEAKRIILLGFFNSFLEKISFDEIKNNVKEKINDKMVNIENERK